MPPVGFWGSSSSVYDTVGGSLTWLTPPAARENDVLLIALVVPSGAPVTLAAGWSVLASDTNLVGTVSLLRRVVTSTEPAQHVFTTLTGLTPQPLGMLLLYRGTNPLAPIVAHGIALVNPASVDYPAPSIALTSYSDLTLLCYYAEDAAGTATFTLPGGVTQRGATLHGPGGASGGTFVVAEFLAEATGATGAKHGTCSGAVIGLAETFGVTAEATLQAASIIPDIPGAIGLVTVGV